MSFLCFHPFTSLPICVMSCHFLLFVSPFYLSSSLCYIIFCSFTSVLSASLCSFKCIAVIVVSYRHFNIFFSLFFNVSCLNCICLSLITTLFKTPQTQTHIREPADHIITINVAGGESEPFLFNYTRGFNNRRCERHLLAKPGGGVLSHRPKLHLLLILSPLSQVASLSLYNSRPSSRLERVNVTLK